MIPEIGCLTGPGNPATGQPGNGQPATRAHGRAPGYSTGTRAGTREHDPGTRAPGHAANPRAPIIGNKAK